MHTLTTLLYVLHNKYAMKNLLEQFLDELEIRYSRQFADRLYFEHPHRNNMYGLKKMLDVYNVKSIGIRVETKDLALLNYPCILHVINDFVIGLDCNSKTITYLNHGKKVIESHNLFKKKWTGNALVVEEATEAVEPDYEENQWKDLALVIKNASIPFLLLVAVFVGLTNNVGTNAKFEYIRIALSFGGLFTCALLLEKQLFGEGRLGDRVCSLFHHSDCNNVLEGPKAKIFGISWSEVGLGYFTANILLLAIFPASSSLVASVNWAAMTYGIWSLYYQWRIAKNWCVLCLMVQVIVWIMGAIALFEFSTIPFVLDFSSGMLSCIAFGTCIMIVHYVATFKSVEKERTQAVQQLRSFKANVEVAKVFIEMSAFYETSFDDSSIIFGNPNSNMLITILSNPHCNPCANMHKQVEQFLKLSGNDACVQYVFSSFNEELEDSNRYLISMYFNNTQEEALQIFANWYTKDKYDYEEIIARNSPILNSEMVEAEMEKHKNWLEKTALIATPIVLVNGHKLPTEYKLLDLTSIAITNLIIRKNILQDINGRSTTPLGTV